MYVRVRVCVRQRQRQLISLASFHMSLQNYLAANEKNNDRNVSSSRNTWVQSFQTYLHKVLLNVLLTNKMFQRLMFLVFVPMLGRS